MKTRLPPKKYKFILDGSVKIKVRAIPNESSENSVHWVAKFPSPLHAYEAKDVCRYSSKSIDDTRPESKDGGTKAIASAPALNKLALYGGGAARSVGAPLFFPLPPPPLDSDQYHKLTDEELRWIASLVDYSTPQVCV
jgi:hypothetical protein